MAATIVPGPSTVGPAGPESTEVRSGLTLTVLGCDGSWPGPAGAGSGYLVSGGGTIVMIDAGPGTFANLQRHVDPASVDAVVITHHHPDHWSDLYALDTHARVALRGRRVPLFAPAGLGDRARLDRTPTLDWRVVTDGDTVRVGGLSCSFHRTDHAIETLAVRIDGPACAVGYSADSGPGWSLAELGTDLDLVLCEATYTSEHEGTAGHMSGSQAGEQARRAGARKLVITHRWPTIDAASVVAEAEAAFGAPVEQASIGKEFGA